MGSDSQALPQGTHLQEFVVERVLGAGGFGITYLARDTGLNRQVVIKENLPAQFAWRETSTGTVRPRHSSGGDADDYQWSMSNFLREAETLASLDHPGIVRVLRKFEANGTAYFAMPFVEGIPFDALIEERSTKSKPFSQDELLGLTTRVLDALGYLHERGIYHRDIKPGNILITQEGLPVLIDFGSARQRLSERSMTVIESPGYTPFEQLQSRGDIGPWSDLYALGATLAKAITFETPPKAADRVMGDPWLDFARGAWCDTYAAWFLQAIDRSMAVDPAGRWQSAGEWRQFLNGGSKGSITSARQLAAPPIPVATESGKERSPNPMDAAKSDPSFKSKAIKVTLIAACIAFVGVMVRPATVYERMLGGGRGIFVMLGETLGILFGSGIIALLGSLVVASIMAAFKKPFRRSVSRGYSIGIIVIASLVLVGNLVSRRNIPTRTSDFSTLDARSARKVISDLEGDIQKMMTEGTDSEGMPKNTDFRFETNSSPANDVDRMRGLMHSFFNDMITLQNDYLAALDQDGLNTLLDADRVANDQSFRESKAILERVRVTVLKFRKRAGGVLSDFPRRLDDYSFDHATNAEMLSGYRAGVEKVLPMLKESWDLEAATVEHMGELIEHLEATRLHWASENGMFMFERDRDLERFNEIMAKITACVERQNKIKENSQKSITENLGNLKARIPE